MTSFISFNPNSSYVKPPTLELKRVRELQAAFDGDFNDDDDEISIHPTYLETLVDAGHLKILKISTTASSTTSTSTAATTTKLQSNFDVFDKILARRFKSGEERNRGKRKDMKKKKKNKKKKKKQVIALTARERIKASLAAATKESSSPSFSTATTSTTPVTPATPTTTTLSSSSSALDECKHLRSVVHNLQQQVQAKDATINVLRHRVAELERVQASAQQQNPTSSVLQRAPLKQSSQLLAKNRIKNQMKSASSSLLEAKSKLKKTQKRTKNGRGENDRNNNNNNNLTPRQRSQLRQQQQKKMNQKSNGLHMSLLQSKLLQRRKLVITSDAESESPACRIGGRAPRGEFGSPIEF